MDVVASTCVFILERDPQKFLPQSAMAGSAVFVLYPIEKCVQDVIPQQ